MAVSRLHADGIILLGHVDYLPFMLRAQRKGLEDHLVSGLLGHRSHLPRQQLPLHFLQIRLWTIHSLALHFHFSDLHPDIGLHVGHDPEEILDSGETSDSLWNLLL